MSKKSTSKGRKQDACSPLSKFLAKELWDVAGGLKLDGRGAAFEDPGTLSLAPTALAFLSRRHPTGVFRHQYASLEAVRDKRNVCVTTGTSSGKSLVFQTAAVDLFAR